MLKKIDRVTVVISTHTQEFFVVKLNSRSLFKKMNQTQRKNSQKETVGCTHEWVSSLLHTTLGIHSTLFPWFIQMKTSSHFITLMMFRSRRFFPRVHGSQNWNRGTENTAASRPLITCSQQSWRHSSGGPCRNYMEGCGRNHWVRLLQSDLLIAW